MVTKLWATYTSRAEEGLQKSLRNLGLDYVDLFLVVRFFFLFLFSGNGCLGVGCLVEEGVGVGLVLAVLSGRGWGEGNKCG